VQPGSVSFSYRISSENCESLPSVPVCGDYLTFYLDGSPVLSKAGVLGWTRVSFGLSPGAHTLSWAYQKDSTCPVPASGTSCPPISVTDAAWIGAVSVTGADNTRWTTVATTGPGATGAPWALPTQPTPAAKLRVCQDTGSPCSASAASASPGVFTISLVLVQPGSLALREGGPPGSYTISLLFPPGAPVTINLAPDPELSVLPGSLVFTAANTPQTVSVSAPDDHVAQAASHTVPIQQTAASSDPTYNTSLPAVPVTLTDADTASVQLNDGGGVKIAPGGAPGAYSLVLTSKPLGAVNVTVVPDPAIAALPSILSFDASNWSVPQAAAVAAPAGGPPAARTVTVAHTVSSVDPGYNGIQPACKQRIAQSSVNLFINRHRRFSGRRVVRRN